MADSGALGDLFAPAFIRGDPESEASVAKWQADNFALTPEMVEQTRGPATTVPTGGMGGFGRLMGGGGSTTIPGSVDPAALKIMAQGGHYDMNARRDAIAKQVLANTAPAAPAAGGRGNMFTAPNGAELYRQQAPAGGIPPGFRMAENPLIGLMGSDGSSFF